MACHCIDAQVVYFIGRCVIAEVHPLLSFPASKRRLPPVGGAESSALANPTFAPGICRWKLEELHQRRKALSSRVWSRGRKPWCNGLLFSIMTTFDEQSPPIAVVCLNARID